MSKFEIVTFYQDKNINLPTRATANSAGYDFEVAKDTIVPGFGSLFAENATRSIKEGPLTFEEIASLTKSTHARPTLVPTGIKCKLELGQYLELSVRSSCPLKSWLILANGVGIIDRDYYNNPNNEGHIYFQVINLSPFDIKLEKGDKIGQGIIKHYEITEDDKATGERIGGFGSTNKPITEQDLIERGVIKPHVD